MSHPAFDAAPLSTVQIMKLSFLKNRCARCALGARLPLATLVLFSVLAGCQDAVQAPSLSEALLTTIALDESLQEVSDSNWPGWRGHNASGVSQCNHLPVEWDQREGWRWRQRLRGLGNSSPVVWEDSVLITSDINGTLNVECYSLLDGQPRWSTAAGQTQGTTHVKNGHASATVVTDGERVYAFFGGAGLHCFSLQDGSIVWQQSLGDLEHHWGTASSPVLYEDLVIQMCDNHQESFLVALNKLSGEEVWRTPRPSNGSWSTPTFVTVQRGDKQFVEMIVNGTGTDHAGGGQVFAYDPLMGHELWNVRGTKDIVCPTAIVHEGLVLSTSGRNGPIIAIRPGGFGEVSDSHVAWREPRGGPYVPTGLAMDHRLYLIADNGNASCYDTQSGTRLWRERLPGKFTASLVAGDGKIYATSEEGTVYVFAPGDEFKLLATNRLNDGCLATPAVAAGNLLIRTESYLYCFGPMQLAAAERE